MTTKEKAAAAAAILLSLVAVYMLWPASVAPTESAASSRPAAARAAAASSASRAVAAPDPAASTVRPREALAAPAARARGDLVVRVLYGGDRTPAADVMVTAYRKNELPRIASAPSVDPKRRRTDAQGIARFPSMRAGRTGLIADRGHWFMDARVEAGKETFVEWVMPAGVTVTGIVVSALGVPVGGADVELESSVVATTDGQGCFTVRGASPHGSIGARAFGHGASKAQQILAHDGRAEVRLELNPAGGSVEGTARDPDGKPLADVRVDIGRWEGGKTFVGDAPPRPARPRTDADGHFRAVGIPPGEQQVRARAPGMVPWSGKCQVTANATTVVDLAFARGNTLRGTLHDADGRPFGDVIITARAGELDWDEVIDPDGTFEIAGLQDGEIDLKVDAEGAGEARARVPLLPGGAVTTCELKLLRGLVARGTVRDETGQPLPRVSIRWPPSGKSMGYTYTDERGAFTIANAPETLTIDIDGEAIVDARFENLAPRSGELDLRARRRAPKTVYIEGTVLDPDGRPAVVKVWASGGGSRGIVEKATDAAGHFEIGPLSSGEWTLSVESRTLPRVAFERRALEANTRWDVGTVRLVAGGEVRVEVVEGDTEGTWFSIYSEKERPFRLEVRQGKGTSEPLPVGIYRLMVSGKTKAAQSIPFEIRAGETATVDVRLHGGVRQRFDMALPDQIQPVWGNLRILGGTDLVARLFARAEEGKPCTAEACLGPGEYTVTAKFGELAGSAAFSVGEREGEPVRIDVARR